MAGNPGLFAFIDYIVGSVERHRSEGAARKMEVSLTRMLWIVFCCMWAIGWLTFGWSLPLINLVGAAISFLAILIPVGKPRGPRD